MNSSGGVGSKIDSTVSLTAAASRASTTLPQMLPTLAAEPLYFGIEWDAENRLQAVKQGGNTLASFAYDRIGRRSTRAAGGVTTTYVYDGAEFLEERPSPGSTTRYLYGPGIDQPLAQVVGAMTTYNAADHLGSVVRMTDSLATPTLSRQYDPWGNLLQGGTTSGFAYTGREWDSESGLHYYRARYYDARFGRFLSPDPTGLAGGVNHYTYVANAPLIARDPMGTNVYYLNDAQAARGFGHAAIIVGGHDGTYTYHSFQPSGYTEASFDSFEDAIRGALTQYGFDEYATYCTDVASQDEAAREKGREYRGKAYDLASRNCDHMSSEMVWAAGINYHIKYGSPNKTFQTIKKSGSAPVSPIQ